MDMTRSFGISTARFVSSMGTLQTEATDTEDGKSGNSTSPGSQADGPYKKAKTLRQSGQSEIRHSRQQPGKSTESNGSKEAASVTCHSIQKNESRPSSVLKRQSEAKALAIAQPQAPGQARAQEQVELEVEAEVYSHTLDRPSYNRHRRAQSHPQDYIQHHNVHSDFAFHAHHQQRNNHNQAYFPTPFIAIIPKWFSRDTPTAPLNVVLYGVQDVICEAC